MNRGASGNLIKVIRRIRCASPDQKKELRDKVTRDPKENKEINIEWISRESNKQITVSKDNG